MTHFLLIGICLLVGYLVRNYTKIPADAYKGVNAVIIYLALPAVSFKYLPYIHWSTDLLLPVTMPVILWCCGWLYMRGYAKMVSLDKKSRAGLTLTSALSNTSFLGFPLVTAYFGEDGLGTAVICDQVTFMLLSTAGIVVALNASDVHTLSAGSVLSKVLRFPPFIACLLALFSPLVVDISPLNPLFDKLAAIVAPLALFSIGMQIQLKGWINEVRHISVAVLFKLLLAPLIIWLLIVITGQQGAVARITNFEAAMPSFLTAGIIANEYRLNAKLSNLVVGISILLSFITTAAWYNIITNFS